MENSRERVLNFEKEIAQNILRASKIENEILNLSKMRKQFVENTSSTGHDFEYTSQKVKNCRNETSLIALDMILLEYELKEIRGIQELKLIELNTQNLNINETIEERNKQIADAHLSNSEVISDILVDQISKLLYSKEKLKNILHQACHFDGEVDQFNDIVIEAIKMRLEAFISNMEEYIKHSKDVCKGITGDYLVLRHNSRIAEKILCERRQSTISAREEMQKNMDKLFQESSLRKFEVEDSLKREQERLLQEARENVMNKENQIDELEAVVTSNWKEIQKEKVRLRRSIKEYEVMYNKLWKKREKEVRVINGELKKFREMVANVEEQVINRKIY